MKVGGTLLYSSRGDAFVVEFSLLSAIFVGACMIEGIIIGGFKETLEVYLLEAVADIGHGYVVLFSLFLSYV